MIVDIDIKHYYLKYIESANSDIEKYEKKYKVNIAVKHKIREFLSTRIEYIKKTLGIDITKYTAWKYSMYKEDDEFHTIVNNKFKSGTVEEGRIALLQLLRYSNVLKLCRDYNRLVGLAKKRSNLKFTEYAEYVRKFYRVGVHKCCLEGYAYHFGYGLGDLMINMWKYKDKPRETYVDWEATRKKKQEIIDAGMKPYDKEEAKVYKLRGIKYDGVPYVQYKTNKEFYDIEIINNRYLKFGALKFKHANYININYRNKSIEEIATSCKTNEDIFNLPLGLRHKLLIYLHNNPNDYVNYIRNAEQYRYNRGAHSIRDARQRYTQ